MAGMKDFYKCLGKRFSMDLSFSGQKQLRSTKLHPILCDTLPRHFRQAHGPRKRKQQLQLFGGEFCRGGFYNEAR